MTESKQKLTLKGGTLVHVDGIPACLAGDTDVETANFDALRPHSTTPYQEYPKMLADGRIVQSADDEADAPKDADLAEAEQADAEAKAADAKRSPLDDVDVEMDNDAYNEKAKKKPAAHSSHAGAKKK